MPDGLPSTDLLLQFIEESGELIQAASKFIRKERGNNPTPVGIDSCREKLLEELADVSLVLDVIQAHWGIDGDEIKSIKRAKETRWQERLS